ncbi:MAG TPA: BadF/BadG/BcrA/BcrD ATPase family protein [Thermoguttaceae bacterium]|nr:BadF/BadG/BcrA/BcrD ATPase family protein [Thermoguttaceae bacterium]
MQSDELVLGIDGGATKTVAWLALRSGEGEPSIVGRGTAGPANPQAIGFDEALQNLDQAIAAAFEDAGVNPGTLAAAVLALAGWDREQNRQVLRRWADQRRLASRLRMVHDALPVLVAGSPEGWGVALISGTGSFAFGQTPDGRSTRAGGWGYLFGDEGSGYAIALAGLRAAAKSADGRAPATQLVDALLRRLDLRESPELIPAVYRFAEDRARIASLADVVTQAADQGDAQARAILDEATGELADMVAAVARRLGFSGGTFPLALTGGVLLGSERLRRALEAHLNSLGRGPASVACVREPVAGAVRLAQCPDAG